MSTCIKAILNHEILQNGIIDTSLAYNLKEDINIVRKYETGKCIINAYAIVQSEYYVQRIRFPFYPNLS